MSPDDEPLVLPLLLPDDPDEPLELPLLELSPDEPLEVCPDEALEPPLLEWSRSGTAGAPAAGTAGAAARLAG